VTPRASAGIYARCYVSVKKEYPIKIISHLCAILEALPATSNRTRHDTRFSSRAWIFSGPSARKKPSG
jgi:hypothetical protein